MTGIPLPPGPSPEQRIIDAALPMLEETMQRGDFACPRCGDRVASSLDFSGRRCPDCTLFELSLSVHRIDDADWREFFLRRIESEFERARPATAEEAERRWTRIDHYIALLFGSKIGDDAPMRTQQLLRVTAATMFFDEYCGDLFPVDDQPIQ